MSERAKADVEESIETIEELEEEMKELEEEMVEALEDVKAHWEGVGNEITDIPVSPYKKDIDVDLFGVAWFPYHLVDAAGEMLELPGFDQKP